MKTLREILGKPVLFHTVFYHGKNGLASSPTGYLSNDPNVIGDQLSAMQNIGGEGCGLVALTYGATVNSFIHGAVMEACRQASEREMPFMLCYDPYVVTKSKTPTDANAAVIADIMHPDTQAMLNSRTYINANNLRPILDFDTGATAGLVKPSTPGVDLWMNRQDFSWLYFGQPDPVATLKKYNALPTMKLPAVGVQADDGNGADRNKSAWDQTKPARTAWPYGGRLFHDMADLVPSHCDYVQMATWNDGPGKGSECTGIEPFASMLWGRI